MRKAVDSKGPDSETTLNSLPWDARYLEHSARLKRMLGMLQQAREMSRAWDRLTTAQEKKDVSLTLDRILLISNNLEGLFGGDPLGTWERHRLALEHLRDALSHVFETQDGVAIRNALIHLSEGVQWEFPEQQFIEREVEQLELDLSELDTLKRGAWSQTIEPVEKELGPRFILAATQLRRVFFSNAQVYFDKALDDYQYDYWSVSCTNRWEVWYNYAMFSIRLLTMLTGAFLTYFTGPPFDVFFNRSKKD